MDTVLQHNDLLVHRVHRHEPPVTAQPLTVIHQDSDIVAINKPPSIPVSSMSPIHFHFYLEGDTMLLWVADIEISIGMVSQILLSNFKGSHKITMWCCVNCTFVCVILLVSYLMFITSFYHCCPRFILVAGTGIILSYSCLEKSTIWRTSTVCLYFHVSHCLPLFLILYLPTGSPLLSSLLSPSLSPCSSTPSSPSSIHSQPSIVWIDWRLGYCCLPAICPQLID